VKVDVWSYSEAVVHPSQSKERVLKSYLFVINLIDKRLIRLQQERDVVSWKDNDYVFVFNNPNPTPANAEDKYWNRKARESNYLVSTTNGVRKSVGLENILARSPDGHYLIGQKGPEFTSDDYYSYDLRTGVIRNLTISLPIPWLNTLESGHGAGYKQWRFLVYKGWLATGKLLITDEYDIWAIDPSGKDAPVSLTNQYGRKNRISLRVLTNIHAKDGVWENKPLIVKSFDQMTKDMGFYQVKLVGHSDPVKLSSGGYIFNWDFEYYGDGDLIKSKDNDLYLIRRESATQFPNYFLTSDFKTFEQLSNTYPEKAYNWLTSELINFITLDGRKEQAVMYKPEDFDPKKKYPVIFTYYERVSETLNKYWSPDDDPGELLDIPLFVSNGYIVVRPDIHYELGKPGEGAVNSIVAAGNYMAKFPWVDAKHMGLEGASWSGYETNYVITHSHLFAAAISNSGLSDFVSGYANLMDFVNSNYYFYEKSQNRMDVTLWERPDFYIKSSPIFYADKVTTPLLIIANKPDGRVPFFHGLEFFNALRRMGKPVWMLQYDDESHGVQDIDKDTKDYLTRSMQFFNYYLKGSSAPKWMVEGIPAYKRGIDDGLEIEPLGENPEPGLLTPEEQKKLDALKHRKPITVTFN
jgi:dienelactone hydrolase